jgi:hypothetical protein
MNIQQLSKYEGEKCDPLAGPMIESFRSIGYNLQTAVADIIDNSISAKAKNVWIDFGWEEISPWISITDDGNGMSEPELVEAMRPGSKNPLSDRKKDDLGRFGLGLKTASFSQCRQLTVVTKQKKQQEEIFRCWNLNYVNETNKWRVLKYLSDQKLILRLKNLSSGTSVIWEDLDRVISKSEENIIEKKDQFLNNLDLVKHHLAMVFHYHIENKKLIIWIKDRKVEAWDPYLKNEPSTQKLGEIFIKGNIQVIPFVLPLHSKIERIVFENASGIKGWNSHQGFYIYRNNRLLLAGEWLGMYKQEEHYKLARILVNIPNTVDIDSEWQLDIKKSVATPPPEVRSELRKIADETRKKAMEVYRQIGKRKKGRSEKENVLVWTDKKSKGKRFYQINRDHPIIRTFSKNHPDSWAKLNRLLRLIEETVPLPLIVSNESANNDFQTMPFEGKASSDLVKMIIELYESYIDDGKNKEQAIEEILRTEPFIHYPELIENL